MNDVATVRPFRSRVAAVALTGLLAAGAAVGGAPERAEAQRRPKVVYWLTILHNNDGESQLIDAGTGLEDFGGVARFATKVERIRQRATGRTRRGVKKAALLVSSGDNFLAGPEFNASLERNERTGDPYYDSIALSLIGYDAMAIGNHEFDFGPDVLTEFIEGFGTEVPRFLSANLNFDGEPSLKALEDEGIITGSTVVVKRRERIGIIGATTPRLPSISSPRNVTVDEDVAGLVQSEVRSLRNRGVNKIVLISHLQNIEEDRALAGMLRGVDVMIAGGGDELLANEGDVLVPGDEGDDEDGDGVGDNIFGPYPLIERDAAGRDVPIVTTPGNYKYVGRLMVGFNRRGRVIAIRQRPSGLKRVAGGDQPDAVEPNRRIQRWVVDPVSAAIAELAENIIATTEVGLDGRRSEVRTTETNLGNLIADGLLWQAGELNDQFGAPEPDVSLANGGGIRNDAILGPGDISELDTFDISPFGNFTSIVPDVSRDTFKAILENAVSGVPAAEGRFAQVGGFSFTYDADAPVGERVLEATLDDGTPIVTGGAVVPGNALHVATLDFLAQGGDDYPFGDVPFTRLGVTDQQTLANYLTSPDGLNGVVTAADYPEGGEGRITAQ